METEKTEEHCRLARVSTLLNSKSNQSHFYLLSRTWPLNLIPSCFFESLISQLCSPFVFSPTLFYSLVPIRLLTTTEIIIIINLTKLSSCPLYSFPLCLSVLPKGVVKLICTVRHPALLSLPARFAASHEDIPSIYLPWHVFRMQPCRQSFWLYQLL